MSTRTTTPSATTHAELTAEFFGAPSGTLFDTRTIAAVRGCSMAKLERDRWAGGGIPFVKDGRMVRYRKRDVLVFLDSLDPVRSTAEAQAGA
jgi:hypothetical protein